MFSLMPWRREKTGTLVPREESPFRLMRREFDNLFDNFFGRWPMGLAEEFDRAAAWDVAVEDKGKEVVVKAPMPGFEPADFDVRVTGDVLTITAEHKEAPAKEGEKVPERSYARAERAFTLPSYVDPEKVEAVYRNGMLEVRLPKTPEAEGRRIEVKT